MSRLDWKRGRFDTDFETNEIHYSLRGHQRSQIGDSIEYLRFERALSESHDIYDEGFGEGKVYRPAVTVPCLHVTHDEGSQEARDTGFYFNDNIYVNCSFDQFTRTGLTEADVRHDRFLKDRFVYDNRVFRVTAINILGQIQKRDTIVSIEGTQVKTDEMVNDRPVIEAPERADDALLVFDGGDEDNGPYEFDLDGGNP